MVFSMASTRPGTLPRVIAGPDTFREPVRHLVSLSGVGLERPIRFTVQEIPLSQQIQDPGRVVVCPISSPTNGCVFERQITIACHPGSQRNMKINA